MKTDWCVIDYLNEPDYGNTNLMGIFSTKENAIEWLRDQINHGWTQGEIDCCSIEEWHIDNY